MAAPMEPLKGRTTNSSANIFAVAMLHRSRNFFAADMQRQPGAEFCVGREEL
jgi:hypothetical protein